MSESTWYGRGQLLGGSTQETWPCFEAGMHDSGPFLRGVHQAGLSPQLLSGAYVTCVLASRVCEEDLKFLSRSDIFPGLLSVNSFVN